MTNNLFDAAKAKLSGAPDRALTIILLAIAGVAILAAFFAHPLLKAAMALWFLFP
jgi:hypothetical protein